MHLKALEFFILLFCLLFVHFSSSASTARKPYVKMPADNFYETLSNGVEFPMIGLGTWLSDDRALFKTALRTALDTGYRAIDTATLYGNEDVIGEVLQEYFDAGKLARKDIFITTKLPPFGHANPALFIQKSLDKLHLDYLDLYLMHQPDSYKLAPDNNSAVLDSKGKPVLDPTPVIDTWRIFEEYYKKGALKAIGISNFNTTEIQDLFDKAEIKPHNLQVETHVLWPQDELVAISRKLNMSFTAYAPLGSPGSAQYRGAKPGGDCMGQPLVQELANKYNRKPAQILLRQLYQRGLHVVPKSINPTRIRENFDIFDFRITPEDMQRFGEEITQREHAKRSVKPEPAAAITTFSQVGSLLITFCIVIPFVFDYRIVFN